MQLEARRTDDAARIRSERKGRTTGKLKRPRLSGSQGGDGTMTGDYAVGLEADTVRMSLAVEAKRSQAIATRGVARSPRVEVRRGGLRLEHSPQEAGGSGSLP